MHASSRLAGLLLVAIIAGAGCYTVLRHPAPLDMAEDGYENGYSDQRACADCHADADLYHYTDPHNAAWYNTYPAPWAYYYDTPWWYDDYWYYPSEPSNGHGGPGDATLEERSGRNAWTRPPGGGPGWLPSQDTPQAPPAVTQPDNTKPNDKPDKNTDKDDKDKKEEKKEKRKLWNR
jgi:hypothetical protein